MQPCTTNIILLSLANRKLFKSSYVHCTLLSPSWYIATCVTCVGGEWGQFHSHVVFFAAEILLHLCVYIRIAGNFDKVFNLAIWQIP